MPGKNFNNDGNLKITLAVKANFSFDFGPVFASSFAALRCFGPSTTANRCQDADFFPAMIHIHIYI